MEIQKFRLIPEGDGFTLVLYLDNNQTEFAAELGAYVQPKQNVRQEIRQILKRNFKNVKVNTVRIMVGTMLVTSFPIGAFTAEAASNVPGTTQVTTETIPYMTHIVKKGDTLTTIANLYGTSVEELMRLNNLKSDKIFVGQALKLPAVSYTVVPGDTLFSISLRFGSSIDSIKAANKLTSNVIFVGQSIVVPILPASSAVKTEAAKTPIKPVQEKQTETATKPVQENKTEAPVAPVQKEQTETAAPVIPKQEETTAAGQQQSQSATNYIVVPGDTLFLIAKRFNTTVDSIKAANNLKTDMITVGQRLVVPMTVTAPPPTTQPEATQQPTTEKIPEEPAQATTPTVPEQEEKAVDGTNEYVVVAGDTLFAIANRFSTSVDSIKERNNLTSNAIFVGQVLHIPGQTVEKAPVSPSFSVDKPITSENSTSYTFSGVAEANTNVEVTFKDSTGKTVSKETKTDENGNFTVSADLSGLTDGSISASVLAFRDTGLKSEASLGIFTKDTTSPTPVLNPLPIVTQANQSEFLLEGTGEVGSVIFFLIRDREGHQRAFQEKVGGNGGYSFSVDLSNLVGAQFGVEVYQEDEFGNRSESTFQTIEADVAAPDIAEMDNFTTITQNNANSYGLSGTTEPNARVEITITDGTATIISNEVSDGEGRFTAGLDLSTLKDGTVTVRVAATDVHGNRGAAFTGTVIKDTTVLPVSSIALDNGGKVVAANVKSYRISGTSEEDGNIVHIIISDGKNTIEKTALVAGGTFDIPFDISLLKDGALNVRVLQEDGVGNKSTEITKTIQKDTIIEAPAVMTSHVAKTAAGGYSYTITGQGEANSTIYISVMGQKGATMINQTVVTDSDGRFTLTMDISQVAQNGPFILVKQTDAIGNESKQTMVGVLSYKVGSGDTLWRISTQFNTTIDEIMSLNGLTSSNLFIGQQLKLPTVASVSAPAFAEEEFFNMGYVYFGSSQNYFDSVRETQGSVNVVSPSYFDLNGDGTLKLTPTVDRYFIAAMQSSGIRVVPFLSNHWDRAVGEAALRNREQLSTEIAEMVRLYNLDGINVDLENITDEYQDEYTDFVRLLREKLPEGKEVSVAVAANPNGWTKGWHGSYDYGGLAKYADYLMIMAYDESYTGSDPGPIASIGWVERSIQYAIDNGVDEKQIVLGVGHYGRYWKDGASYGGEGISNTQIQHALETYGGTVTYDERTQSAKAVFTVEQGDPIMKVNGKELTPGTYTVWFENADAIKAKIDLIHQYDIKGLGNWSLGQENPQLWNDFAAWLNPETGAVPVNGAEPNLKS